MWTAGGEEQRAVISSRPQITLQRLLNCTEIVEGVAKYARPNLGEGVLEGDTDEVGGVGKAWGWHGDGAA